MKNHSNRPILFRLSLIASLLFFASCDGPAPPNFKSAIYSGDIEAVNQFIKNGVNVNSPVGLDMQPLYIATSFARNSADPDKRKKEENYQRIVEILLNHGADPNIKEIGGDSALARATRNGHQEIVKLLIAHGADVNLNE